MAREGDTRTCSECARFTDDPLALESMFVGMTALSSAFGSTRGDAGVCDVTDSFQNPAAACGEFQARRTPEEQ